MADDYRKTYEAAAGELESLLQQRERTEERILSLRKTMNGLSELIQQQEGSSDFTDHANARLRKVLDTSITGDIEKVINSSPHPLTTTEIKVQLEEIGSLLERHSNPLATINAIVSRLTESGRVTETAKDGRKAWARKRRGLSYYMRVKE
jgi:hypothetical protein